MDTAHQPTLCHFIFHHLLCVGRILTVRRSYSCWKIRACLGVSQPRRFCRWCCRLLRDDTSIPRARSAYTCSMVEVRVYGGGATACCGSANASLLASGTGCVKVCRYIKRNQIQHGNFLLGLWRNCVLAGVRILENLLRRGLGYLSLVLQLHSPLDLKMRHHPGVYAWDRRPLVTGLP